MPAAQKAPNEPERLAALRALNLLDTPPEPGFDRIAGLARTVSGAGVALVVLIDEDRAWLKAKTGIEGTEIQRNLAFCAHAILSPEVTWVEDARLDARFADNPLVTGEPHFRFYAGAPIVSPEGYRVGTLCIYDAAVRAYDASVAESLGALAEFAADQCRLRRARYDLGRSKGMQAVADQALSDFISQAPINAALIDRDQRIVQASPRFLADYGLTAEAAVGVRFDKISPDAAETNAVYARCMAGERVHGEARRYITPDGRYIAREFEAAPWRDRKGAIIGGVLMNNDVTELFKSREAVQRSEERLTLALHISDTLVWELDFKRNRSHVSGDVSAFFDTPPSFADFQRSQLCTVHAEDLAHVEEAWRGLLENGSKYRVEHRLKRGDGREVWVLAAAELFRDAVGRPERVIGVSRDITERKRHEIALAAARVEAEAADRAKSEFLANMSHEIRTPLNGVLGIAGALKRTPLAAAQREMVGLIETSGENLERLLTDVLDLARIDSGQFGLQVEPFQLHELAGEVCALFGTNARAKGLNFDKVLPDAAHRLMGDPLRLRQVLNNLLSNAVKFTERGGIEFRVDAQERADGRVALTFTVSDTGIGFDETVKERLFRRFEQADGSITRRFGGTGLGLAISRALAEGMDGTLTAESEPGRGAAFTLSLTLPKAEQPGRFAEPSPAAETAPSERPVRVLLAEDHEINRRVVQLILDAAGVDLTMVCDGAQAVAAAAAGDFDLILMDMQMPVMGGLAATRAIRRAERERGAARTSIISLTANAMPEHVTASREAGADDHLTKPITAEALVRLVHSFSSPCEDIERPLRMAV